VTYRVIVTPEAEMGIRNSFHYILQRSPLNGARWLQGLYHQIDTLERLPERGAYARERDYVEEDLRQLLFKSHRIVYWVDKAKSIVYILQVRHTKRRTIGDAHC
jgi:plasmid stabilization system protein ParE